MPRSTYRTRHWKARAIETGAVEEFGGSNISRMKKGLAPQRYSGAKGGMESIELAHVPDPWSKGGTTYIELWPQDHALIDPQRHPGY